MENTHQDINVNIAVVVCLEQNIWPWKLNRWSVTNKSSKAHSYSSTFHCAVTKYFIKATVLSVRLL